MFIGYLNKLRSNFCKMQPSVLINLFKAYCCSYYGSQLWKFNSSRFDKICKSWNIAVRLILGLPYNAHTYLLGPLMGQTGIREQLYTRIFSSFFFFRKNYLLLSCATSVRPSVRLSVRPSVCPSVCLSVCGNNFFSR